MKLNGTVRLMLIVVLLVVNVSCDQISKNIVRERISEYERISVFKNYFTLTKTENSGAFLSAGDSLPEPWKSILLTFLPVAVLTVGLIFLFVRRELPGWTQLGICLMIGGGIGNIYDRTMYGSVTDFMHIDLGLFQTGIFNVADVSIMTGMFVMLVNAYRIKTSPLNETES
jgi:signal peptidase II